MLQGFEDINYEVHLTQIFIKPEDGTYKNVVRRVNWMIEFKLEDLTSVAIGSSNLGVTDGSDFIDLENLTKEQIISWCITEELFKELLISHAFQLRNSKEENTFVEWSPPFLSTTV